MDTRAGRLAGSKEPWDDGVFVIAVGSDHFASVVGRRPAHVVVHGGEHGRWFHPHVPPSKDLGRFNDARQSLCDELGG